MPGLKTKKGVAKRFRLTKKRKVKYGACGKSHLLSSKTTKRLRRLRRGKTVRAAKTAQFLRRMLPHG